MRGWLKGLTTRSSARRAARWGGIACLLEAARLTFGMIAYLLVANKPLAVAIAWTVGAGTIPFVVAAAGLRLIMGKGRIVGSIAVLLVAFDVASVGSSGMTANIASYVTVSVALLILMINGVRGAFALQSVDYDAALGDVFN